MSATNGLDRSPQPRRAAATPIGVLALVLSGLLIAVPLMASPAAAAGSLRLAVPVFCSDRTVTLGLDGASYRLSGVCGEVRVTGDDVSVDLPNAVRVIVTGQRARITGKNVYTVLTTGAAPRIALTSVRELRATGPASVIAVRGQVGDARVGGRGGSLSAREILDLRVLGSGHRVIARRGWTSKVPGARNTLVFRTLDRLLVSGVDNRVRVKQGRTRMTVAGSTNRISVPSLR